jgi:hypothetical protein
MNSPLLIFSFRYQNQSANGIRDLACSIDGRLDGRYITGNANHQFGGTIDNGWLLNTDFGGDTIKGRRQCREYVYHANEGDIENPFKEVVHQSILGTAAFVEWVRQKLPRKRQREIPSLTKLQHDISVEPILGVVAKAGNAQADDLRDR